MDLMQWWWTRFQQVLLDPRSFFSGMETGEDFKTPSIFLGITQLVGLAVSGTFFAVSLIVGGLPAALGNAAGVVALLIAALLYAAFSLGLNFGITLWWGGLFHVFYHYLGAGERFSATYRILAYASAMTVPIIVLNAVGGPVVDAVPALQPVLSGLNLLGLLYLVYLTLLGVSTVHDISMWRAAVPYLVVGVLLLVVVGIIVAIVQAVGPGLGLQPTTTGLR